MRPSDTHRGRNGPGATRSAKRRMPSIYIETFGCQMNEADSRYIAERATSAGYSVASAAEEANVIVLNTCTVRDNAERRAYGRMNHLNALKRVDPSLRLVVTGCLAEQDRDRMKKLAPHVDAIFGTRELAELGEQLAAWQPELRRRGLQRRSRPPYVARRHRRRGKRRIFAPARLRHGAARLFVLLHVLHRAARSGPLRSPAPKRDPRRDARTDCAGRARNRLGRPNGQRVERSGERRRFWRSLPVDRSAARPRAARLHLPASQGFHGEDSRRSLQSRAAQSAHSPSAAVRQRRASAAHESKVHAGAV